MRSHCKLINYQLIVILFALVLGPLMQSSASEIDGVIYQVRISQDIMTKPHVMAAWRIYGDERLQWRTEKFFEQFPDEKKYRYTYKEELDCRKRLAEHWISYTAKYPDVTDEYLDELAIASKSLFFPEYIYYYFREGSWEMEKDRFRLDDFKRWKKEYIKGHNTETKVEIKKIKL